MTAAHLYKRMRGFLYFCNGKSFKHGTEFHYPQSADERCRKDS